MSIDAVITWVDGANPAHRQKLDAWLAQSGGIRTPAADRTRFNDAGEIDWCIRSLLRFAPWFRRIHIVVDAQVPAIIDRLADSPFAGRFNIVDHREIFRGFQQHLPTFNSRSIITMLWRIEGLSDNFVYFNDDMFLLREVAPEDFFRDGKVVQRGLWRPQSGSGWLKKIAASPRGGNNQGRPVAARGRMFDDLPASSACADQGAAQTPNRAGAFAARWSSAARAPGWLKRRREVAETRVGNLDSQQLSARLVGYADRYFRHYHNPYPMRRSTLEAFFAARPDLLERNASFRLRSNEQFKTEVVASHLELLHDNAIIDNRLHVVQLKPSEQLPMRVRRKMAKADADPNAAFVCVQSLELAPESIQNAIAQWLNRRIDIPGLGENRGVRS